MELSPGTGIIYENPQFINLDQLNFELSSTSPCINSGNPNQNLDEDGSISDIGSNTFIQNFCLVHGDINNDYIIDILDIIQLVCIILDNSNCLGYIECSDINEDNEINVIDIIEVVNIVIN